MGPSGGQDPLSQVLPPQSPSALSALGGPVLIQAATMALTGHFP